VKLKFTHAQKRRASTSLALALSEFECAELLLESKKYRETAGRLYFSCFHVGHAILADRLAANASHATVEGQIHHSFKQRNMPPRRYKALHSALHALRTLLDYKTSAGPDPKRLASQRKGVQAYLRYVTRIIPRVEIPEILADIVAKHRSEVKELSFDIYHPRPYYDGQTRLTVWQPAHAVRVFTPIKLIRHARRFLANIEADFPQGYVAGLNSRLNQYGEPVHLLMLDLDTTDAAVEAALRPIGGTLVKSGRGFHFIGNKPIHGQKRWEATLRRLRKVKRLRQLLDVKHIDYSIERGYSTLRLTAGPDKPRIPFFFKDV
jgi:uncharacterized protein (UPF0332 family)